MHTLCRSFVQTLPLNFNSPIREAFSHPKTEGRGEPCLGSLKPEQSVSQAKVTRWLGGRDTTADLAPVWWQGPSRGHLNFQARRPLLGQATGHPGTSLLHLWEPGLVTTQLPVGLWEGSDNLREISWACERH